MFQSTAQASRIQLRLGNRPGATGELRATIDRLAAQFGLSAEDRFDLKLAATEALTNALRGLSAGHLVDVTLEGRDDAVDVEVANGQRFGERPLRREEDGGRGIPLMLALVDKVEFVRTARGTCVRIRKRIPSG